MKRMLAAIGLLFLLLPSAVRAQTDNDFVITDFAVDLRVEDSGVLTVTENIVVNFANSPHHGIFRDIPFAYRDSVGNESFFEIELTGITQDGSSAIVDESRSGSHVRFRIGDPDRKITGKHSYNISYSVIGALSSLDDVDELYWNVTGNDWGVPINKASAKVSIPGEILQSACYQGVRGSTERCTAVANTFTASRPLSATEGLTVGVGFKKGLVPILVGQKPPTLIDEFTKLPSILLFAFTAISGAFYVLRRWYRGGRDLWWSKRSAVSENMPATLKPIGSKSTIVAEYEPPAGLRPAEVGVLIDERAETKDVAASIIDLAVRGYIKIEEIPKKWRFGAVDYSLHKQNQDRSDLRKYEVKLLDEIFESKSTIKVSELKNSFYTALAEVKKLLYQEVETRGLFAKNPEKTRNTNFLIGALLMSAGAGVLIPSAVNFATHTVLVYAFSFGLGLSLVGLVWLLLANAMPGRTALGYEMYLRAKGYELFINKAEKYRQRFHENENYFTQILPYAILFGATKKLAKAMKDMGIQPANTGMWYVGTHPFDIGSFGESMSGFEKSLSSAMASSPSGSGSGGGGFSGGGGGGGGGGGW